MHKQDPVSPTVELIRTFTAELEDVAATQRTVDAELVFAALENVNDALEMAAMPELQARLQRLYANIASDGPKDPRSNETMPNFPVEAKKVWSIIDWLHRLEPLAEEQLSLQAQQNAAGPESWNDYNASQPEGAVADTNASAETIPAMEVTETETDNADELVAEVYEEDFVDIAAELGVTLPAMDVAEVTEEEPEITFDLSDFTPPADLPESHQEILASLWEETAALLPEFAKQAEKMRDSIKARHCYCELLQTLGETCAYLGLSGLQLLFDMVAIRLQSIDQVDPELADLLEQWPVLLHEYLQSGASEESCLCLMQFIDDATWGERLDEETQQAILENLVDFQLSDDEFMEETAEDAVLTPEDISLVPSDGANQEVFQAFLLDSPNHTHALFHALSSLHGDLSDKKAFLQQAQRASHTLKGAANLIGIKGVANISHAMEEIFEALADGKAAWSLEMKDMLLSAADCVSSMIDHLLGRDQPPEDALPLLNALVHWRSPEKAEAAWAAMQEHHADTEVDASPADDKVVALPSRDNAAERAPAAPAQEEASAAPAQQQFAAPQDNAGLEQLLQLAEEMSINTVQAQELYKRVQLTGFDLKGHDTRLNETRLELEGLIDSRSMARKLRPDSEHAQDLDPLEMDRYDDMHRCSHQLFEAIADVRELNQKLQDQLAMMDALMRQQHRHIDTLQHQLLSRQRVAAQVLSGRLQRCVRQACRAAGKLADLVIVGEDIQVDRELVEKLADPLMHLLRNAVDHGIEDEQSRLATGKSGQGLIALNYRQDGRFLEISLSDDGRGLDFDSIYEKAKQRGLLPADGGRPDNQSLAQLVWLPGFSTKDKATQLSGRGIGMDAVRSQVELLGGTVRFSFDDEGGCRLLIRVPVKEITQYMLLVLVGAQRFALPTAVLKQILPTHTGELEEVAGKPYLEYDGQLYPYIDLAQRLYGQPAPEGAGKPVVIAELNERTVAIAVDMLLTGEQLVVRTPGKLIPGLRGVFGLTILGDGSLVPVLNLSDLLQQNQSKQAYQTAHIITESQVDSPKILVVDDSLSVRSTLKQLLQDCGFEVVTASDGLDAVEKLRHITPNLLLVDMEMPRMDGLELTRHLRQQQDWANMPVVMLTSRSHEKHRSLAHKAGVTAYATKPYNDNELMDTIRELLT
ncbi:Chemotaxis protein histidine kinase and related kinase [Hahella chejuensis KCTC 2396]|uniref:Chemotaxis protein CheA n=1 Tax=Hahella chejuensis (strain KCTC 2396) TaxID=349521 RepID=Q2SA42_HAHCH|nr:response regulator [Hahella chejuensis]ABC32482.1 Chemotaxis protein histidine kinase and related kinase [Hahella chejuensis KCTC 2396]